MSGHVSGVSVRLQQLYPNAKYFTHCRSHALNLVIVASCKSVVDINNFMDTFKELTLFFGYSSKRKTILTSHLKDKDEENLLADCVEHDKDNPLIPERHYKGLPVLCDTRWLTRVDSIDCLLNNFVAICKALEAVRDCSSVQSARDADSFLKKMLSFEFLASAVISHYVLAYTRPLSVAFQAKDCDLLKSHQMAQRLVKNLKDERGESVFHRLWERIVTIASKLDLEPAKKRTVARQHRANPSVENIEGHYRVAYYYAFIDHAINHLTTRFPEELKDVMLATYFIPCNVEHISDDVLAKIKKEFLQVLPHPSEFEVEVRKWKRHMAEIEIDDDRACTSLAALQRTIVCIILTYMQFCYFS